MRDPRTDPIAGDAFFHPRFGVVGTTFVVKRRGPHKKWGEQITCQLATRDGRQIRRPCRNYAVSLWWDLSKDMRVTARGDGDRAPLAHDWMRVSSKTWHCRWCDGYIRTTGVPSPEDKPTEHARAMYFLIHPKAAQQSAGEQ